MQVTIFTANCIGQAANCSYPNKVTVVTSEQLREAVKADHVCAEYKGNYRGISIKQFHCTRIRLAHFVPTWHKHICYYDSVESVRRKQSLGSQKLPGLFARVAMKMPCLHEYLRSTATTRKIVFEWERGGCIAI